MVMTTRRMGMSIMRKRPRRNRTPAIMGINTTSMSLQRR
jgi:hypothetical protein